MMRYVLEQEDIISIIVSILCGTIIGFEREYNNKSAGFRTIILICLGSTIFTIVSRHGAGSDDRVSANIITGIGFIGAGVIFKDKVTVLGLTTAAVIWTTAGIGMATGIGYHLLAFSMTIFTIIVLSLFDKVEDLIAQFQKTKSLAITFRNADMQNLLSLEEELTARNIRAKRMQINKMNDQLVIILRITGSRKQLLQLNEDLVRMENIVEFY